MDFNGLSDLLQLSNELLKKLQAHSNEYYVLHIFEKIACETGKSDRVKNSGRVMGQ